ncbi:MAG: DNA-3-methyladenine glycosylase I [Pseudomonadota bacterium]
MIELKQKENPSRCGWVGAEKVYVDYHDTEWGVPERSENKLFENLILESFQSGLSWITILRKRSAFRRAFAAFNPDTISSWGSAEVARLCEDARIVRHRGKIEAAISNARAFQIIQADEGFSDFFWQFVDERPLQNNFSDLSEVPSQTALSTEISRALKSRGFRFCGPTVVYSFMQASGLVNDHLVSCHCHNRIAQLRR